MISAVSPRMPQIAFGRGFEDNEFKALIARDEAALMRISYKIGTGEINAKDGAHNQIKVFNQVLRAPHSGFVPAVCDLFDPSKNTRANEPKTKRTLYYRVHFMKNNPDKITPFLLSRFFVSVAKAKPTPQEALRMLSAPRESTPILQKITQVLIEIAQNAPKK